MFVSVLFGEGSPEESHSYRLLLRHSAVPIQRGTSLGREPLPLTFAFAAEQALTGNISLACKDAPALSVLSSSAHSVQVAFYLFGLVCDI